MKIKSIETKLVSLPLAGGGWADAISRTTHIELILVDLVTDTGVVGTGYTYTSGYGSEAVKTLLDTEIVPRVIGQPVAPRGLWYKTWMHVHWVGGGGVTTMALSALDIALWDALAREAEQPLYSLLGGLHHERLPVYASGINLNKTQDELVEQVEGWKEAGYNHFKVKVGKASVKEDVSRLQAVRDAAGDRAVMVDANQGWDIGKAIRSVNAYRDLDIYWVEEPLLADDIVGHRRLKEVVGTPIATGENAYTIQQFTDLMVRGAVDYVQADVCRVGGITPYLEIAAVARAFNIPLAPHYMPEISGQVLCCLSNGHIIENIDGGSLTDLHALAEPMPVVDGYYVPSDRVGHGIVFDRDYLDAHIKHR